MKIITEFFMKLNLIKTKYRLSRKLRLIIISVITKTQYLARVTYISIN